MPKLTDIELDEVSVVDKPANKDAKIVLMKRDSENPDDSDDVEKAPAGLRFAVGFKEGGGSEVQSVLFNNKTWTKDRAKRWLKDHKFKGLDVDETTNLFRYRQTDPDSYARIRVMTPGKQFAKALRTGDSFTAIQSAVQHAVREKFSDRTPGKETYIWVRDLFDSSAVFDYEGQTYRTEYEIGRTPEGEMDVTLGEKIAVEVVYQDVVSASAPADVPNEVAARFNRLQSGLSKAVAQ